MSFKVLRTPVIANSKCKSIKSPSHCCERSVKLFRVPVIATRDQKLYPESLSLPVRSELVSKVLSLPQEPSSSIQSPSHFHLRSMKYPESLSISTRGKSIQTPCLLALKVSISRVPVIASTQSPSHCL